MLSSTINMCGHFLSLRELYLGMSIYYSACATNLRAYFHKMTFWIEAPSLYWKWHQKSRVLSRILTATVNIRYFWPQKARKCSHAVKKLKIGSKNSSKSLKTIVQVNLWCKNNKKNHNNIMKILLYGNLFTECSNMWNTFA